MWSLLHCRAGHAQALQHFLIPAGVASAVVVLGGLTEFSKKSMRLALGADLSWLRTRSRQFAKNLQHATIPELSTRYASMHQMFGHTYVWCCRYGTGFSGKTSHQHVQYMPTLDTVPAV